LLGTSTDIPFSTRMPLVSFEFFTVILYNMIVLLFFSLQVPPRQDYTLMIWHKKSVRLDSSSPLISRYRQTPSRNEPKKQISHARFLSSRCWPIDFKTKVSISLRPPCFFGDFTDQDSECLPCETGMSPPIPTAKIVIFQTNALLVIFFLRVAHILFSLSSLLSRHNERACPNFFHSTGRLW
jgi:hypothetical protein